MFVIHVNNIDMNWSKLNTYCLQGCKNHYDPLFWVNYRKELALFDATISDDYVHTFPSISLYHWFILKWA